MGSKKMSDKKRFLIIFSILLTCVYLLALSGLYFLQEKMIFLNVRTNQETATQLNTLFPKSELFIETEGAISLHGWHLPKKNSEILNICFNGNGDEATQVAYFWHQTLKGAIVTFNYRGYGKSTGKSSQEKLFNDALLIFDTIKAKYPQYKKIYIIGRSLGTGIACHLASKRDCAGLLLISPYDSILNISRQNYPIFPVKLCLRHPFDSQLLADKIEEPTFFIAAKNDSLIPISNSLNLYNQWQSKKEIHYVPNAGHNNIFQKNEFLTFLKDFYIFAEK
ncbi:MAG: hypothetical protein COA79_12015 [Planctomycetota bacterium]|nr:MAG: hypothetical protein COA79_12015 [Planctomycetota bacterium]